MLQLYTNIRNRRKELGLTQTELAERLGYADKSMIAKIEAGNIDLAQSKIWAFADALQTSPSDLYGWDESQDKPFSIGGAKALELIEKYSRLTSANQEAVSTLIDKLLEAQS